MMPKAWLASLRALLEQGSSTDLPPVDDDQAPALELADDAPYSVLEVIAVLSPASVPPGAWAITGMDAACDYKRQ